MQPTRAGLQRHKTCEARERSGVEVQTIVCEVSGRSRRGENNEQEVENDEDTIG